MSVGTFPIGETVTATTLTFMWLHHLKMFPMLSWWGTNVNSEGMEAMKKAHLATIRVTEMA